MSLELSMALGEYDLTSPLDRGEVTPKGIELNIMNYHSADRHWRMGRHLAFDVCEYSIGSYLVSRQWPEEYPFTAIPVFPHRRFRHSYMFKHVDAAIDDPNDFSGKDIGLKNWQNSAGFWMRGICAEHYGLDLESVHWKVDSVPGNVSEFTPPDRYEVEPVPAGTDLETMLAAGELDGALYPAFLDAMKTEGSGVEQVFDDTKAVEQAYFVDTGIFPVMHVVVIRDEILAEHPWVAQNLYEAFDAALDLAMNKLEDPRWTALAWARHHLEEQQDLLGMDPYAYGIGPNEGALEKALEYAHDQGMIPRRYDFEELFVPSTLDAERLAKLEAQGAAIQRQPDRDE